MTFMELINTNEYMTIERLITNHQYIPLSENTYNNIEKLVKYL